MGSYELLRLALRALAANKFRAALTMLGLVIGVAAVIAVMAVGSGGQAMIAQEILKYGTLESLHLQRDHGADRNEGTRTTLTLDDVDAIRESFPQLTNTSAIYYLWSSEPKVRYREKLAQTVNATGVESEAARIVSNNEMAYGRYVTHDDHLNRTMVAVIDENLRDQFFAPQDTVLGQELNYGANTLTIVGVMKSPKGLVYMLGEQAGNLVVPLSVAMMIDGENREVDALSAQVPNLAQKEQTQERLKGFLKARHGGKGNYKVQAMDSLVGMFNSVTGIMALVISAVAAISLLVGGIGIMNIMLVSVTERTREIGLRKAIGARRRDVLAQFLWEAVVLSICGGVIGIFVGLGLASAGTALVHKLSPELSFAAPVRWGAVLLAAGISVAIGIFFGFYPAYRASKLSPVEALRYE